MNKNNPFVKFAHFYVKNLKGIKEELEEIYDTFAELLSTLLELILRVFSLLARIIYVFIPIGQIYCSCIAEYLVIDKMLDGKINERICEGYYSKKDIKTLKTEVAKLVEQEANND